MTLPLKVLIVEDNPADAEMVLLQLRNSGFEPDWVRVDTEADYVNRLHGGLDLVLSDYQMPTFNGLRALELLKQSRLEVPFVLVSGTIGEDIAVAAMKNGAADYLMKDRLERLGPAVKNALAESRLHRERIAERKQLEEQVRQAQKMEAIGTLAGGIAHDFNNILAAICGFTELAQMVLKDNPDVRGYLGSVLKASSRATDLVRQILTFSRQQPQERLTIMLQPVVAETLQLLRATIPTSIEFETELAADAPTVLADATQVHQVLMNLGTNAWHAMKNSTGRLRVKLERWVVDPAQTAREPLLTSGVYARISVGDTGNGMDQATLRRIFEPFFTTKPSGEGTGLGLAVVHGIMHNHDGAVTVQSRLGEGTVFHLYFPQHAGIAIMAPPKEGPVPRGNGECILVVDDEAMIAELIQETLSTLGYQVEFTTQPEEALEMVRSDPERFDLVLTDHTMPGVTGLLLAGLIMEIRPGLPVIMMTGYSAALMSEPVEAVGIRQLLLKPITVHSLGTAVQTALTTTLLAANSRPPELWRESS